MHSKKQIFEKSENAAKKILFTGGHGGTAVITIVEEAQKYHANWRMYWVGPKVASEGSRIVTIEKKTLEKFGLKFISLTTGKLQKKFTIHTIPSLFKIPLGFIQAFAILLKIKPDLVFSLGGYASVPVVITAYILRIPVVIHDQTGIGLGLANRITAPFATKLLAARSANILFKYSNASVVGNPIRKSIFKVKLKMTISNPPVLFIFTGSRGSQIINKVIDEVLEELLQSYQVYHLCGGPDHSYFTRRKSRLAIKVQSNYHVFAFIDPNEVYKYYEKADIVVARAGANTVSEIMLIKRPSILIPLPILNYDEQGVNANIAKKYGVASVLQQDDLNAISLTKEIDYLFKNYTKIVSNLKYKQSPDINAANLVYKEITKLLS